MRAAIFIFFGAVLMVMGAVLLIGWVGGKSRWFDAGVYDRRGASKTDRLFLNLYFTAKVLTPLLMGAILIVFGLLELR